MNKKLGALALVGASAVVLAGCAGGGGTSARRAGDRRPDGVARRHGHPADGARLPQGDVRGRERGLDPHHRGEDLGRPVDTYTAALSLERLARRRRGRQHAGARLRRRRSVPRHHRHQGAPRRRRPAAGPRRRRHYDGAFYAAPYYAGGRIVFYTPQIRRATPCRRRSTSTSPRARSSRPTRSRASTRPARTGTTPFPTSGRTAERSPSRTATSGTRSSPARRASRASRSSRSLPQRLDRAGGRQRADPQDRLLRRVMRLPLGSGWVNWRSWPRRDAESPGCPDTYGTDLAAFALPGLTAARPRRSSPAARTSPSRRRATHPEKAKAALDDHALGGLPEAPRRGWSDPAKHRSAASSCRHPDRQGSGRGAGNSKFTPDAPELGRGRGRAASRTRFVKIAQGGDVPAIAAELDTKIEAILNK